MGFRELPVGRKIKHRHVRAPYLRANQVGRQCNMSSYCVPTGPNSVGVAMVWHSNIVRMRRALQSKLVGGY